MVTGTVFFAAQLPGGFGASGSGGLLTGEKDRLVSPSQEGLPTPPSRPSAFVCHYLNPTACVLPSPTFLPLWVPLSFSSKYVLSDRWSAPSRGSCGRPSKPSTETVYAAASKQPCVSLDIPNKQPQEAGVTLVVIIVPQGPTGAGAGCWAESSPWKQGLDLPGWALEPRMVPEW